MSTVIQLVIALVVLVLGGKFFISSQKNPTGADPELKDKLDALKKNIEINLAQESQEEQNRQELIKKNEEEKNKDISNEDLAKFFNDHPKP